MAIFNISNKNNTKNRFFYPTGKKEIPVRKRVFNKDIKEYEIQTLVDKETGEVVMQKWYDYIQSHSDSCNIRVLFETAIRTDNLDLLHQRTKMSIDLTQMPKDLLEAQKQLDLARNYFDSLTRDEKFDFGNNFREFISRQGKFSQAYIDSHKKTVVQKPADSVVQQPVESKKGADSVVQQPVESKKGGE